MTSRLGNDHEALKRKRLRIFVLLTKNYRNKILQTSDLPVNMQHLGLQKSHDILRDYWRRFWCRTNHR